MISPSMDLNSTEYGFPGASTGQSYGTSTYSLITYTRVTLLTKIHRLIWSLNTPVHLIIGRALDILGVSGSYSFIRLVRDLYCSPKFLILKNHWIFAAFTFLPIVS